MERWQRSYGGEWTRQGSGSQKEQQWEKTYSARGAEGLLVEVKERKKRQKRVTETNRGGLASCPPLTNGTSI